MGKGGRGEYSYLFVLPDEFLLKSAVIKVNFKRNSSGRTRIYEYSPPPPINALVSPLHAHMSYAATKALHYKDVKSCAVVKTIILRYINN